MSGVAVLDTGVVLGFCFRDDSHHHRCRLYLEENRSATYVSAHVLEEWVTREPTLATEIADGIFDHISCLHNAGLEGALAKGEISTIRQTKIDDSNPAGVTLYAFYRRDVSAGIQFADLTGRLRELARDIELHAIENREFLLEQVTAVWERTEEYADIDAELASIPADDRRICLDAHDVAQAMSNPTELATTNPGDLVADGHRKLLLSATALADVVSLASRS